MIRFTVDLQRTGVDPSYVTRNVIRGTMKYSSEELRRQLTQNSPKGETKFLYASWYIEENGDLQRVVYSDVKYAEWGNNGTGLFGPRHDVIRLVVLQYSFSLCMVRQFLHVMYVVRKVRSLLKKVLRIFKIDLMKCLLEHYKKTTIKHYWVCIYE